MTLSRIGAQKKSIANLVGKTLFSAKLARKFEIRPFENEVLLLRSRSHKCAIFEQLDSLHKIGKIAAKSLLQKHLAKTRKTQKS
jgi:hypothetical protein